MPVNPVEASLRNLPDLTIIDLRGEIDAKGEDLLDQVYSEAEKTNPGAIVLNFSNVGYINSTGIALIVSMLAKARKSGVKLLAYGLSSHYIEIFQITRLSDFMKIFPDEASALSAIQHNRDL
jgi:anti-sigma B factor antagonist